MEEALDLLEAGEPVDVVVEGGEEVHVPAGGEHGEVGGQAAQPGDLLQGLVLPGGGGRCTLGHTVTCHSEVVFRCIFMVCQKTWNRLPLSTHCHTVCLL